MYKYLFILMGACSSLFAVDVQINTKDYSDLPTTNTKIDAVVLDKSGNMSEQSATFNPATGSVNVNVEPGENASVFFPDLGDRYQWYNGHWVNKAGYYYENNQPVSIGVDNWDTQWNNYWNHHWHDNWHRYYDNHPGGTGWRGRRDWNHHWHDHSRYHRNGHHGDHHGDHHHSHHGHHSHHSHHGGHHGGHHK